MGRSGQALLGEATTLLLNVGCEKNKQDTRGVTPLHIAARNGDDLSLSVLVKGGADVSLAAEGGRDEPITPTLATSSTALQGISQSLNQLAYTHAMPALSLNRIVCRGEHRYTMRDVVSGVDRTVAGGRCVLLTLCEGAADHHGMSAARMVGRCRLTYQTHIECAWNQALETIIRLTAFKCFFQFQLALLQHGVHGRPPRRRSEPQRKPRGTLPPHAGPVGSLGLPGRNPAPDREIR